MSKRRRVTVGSAAGAVVREVAKAAYKYATTSRRSVKRERKTSYRRRPANRAMSELRVRVQNRKRTSRKSAMKRRMKKFECFVNQRTATHTRRVRRFESLLCLGGARAAVENGAGTGSIAALEACMADLRAFDPSVNDLVSMNPADPAKSGFTRDICMSVYRKILVKNNYQVPVRVKVYACRPRDATADLPGTLYVSGMTDQGAVPANNPLECFTDSEDLKAVWEVRSVSNKVLMPGQMTKASMSTGKFDYLITTNDEHTLPYQRKQGGFIWFVWITGLVGHDAANAALVNTMQCGVDIQYDSVVRFEYDAGKNLNDFSYDLGGSIINPGVCTNRPIADNQPYSVA